jgi:hypothetical protein
MKYFYFILSVFLVIKGIILSCLCITGKIKGIGIQHIVAVILVTAYILIGVILLYKDLKK